MFFIFFIFFCWGGGYDLILAHIWHPSCGFSGLCEQNVVAIRCRCKISSSLACKMELSPQGWNLMVLYIATQA